MTWAAGHLESHRTVQVTEAPDWVRLRVGLLPTEALQRVQAKIARLIGRIQRHGDFAGYGCTSIRPAPRGFGSVLEFGGAGGAVVSVLLSVEVDGDRPRLGVHAQSEVRRGHEAQVVLLCEELLDGTDEVRLVRHVPALRPGLQEPFSAHAS